MPGQKNYFGKDSIRPDFLNPKKTLEDAESGAQSNEETGQDGPIRRSLRQLESNPLPTKSLYVGGTNSRIKNLSKKKSKTKLGTRLLRSSPALLALGLIIVLVVLFFGSTSFLGPHIEALFTDATNADYTAYNLRANEVFTEILSGQEEMPSYLKERLEKEGITVNADQTLSYKDTVITADNYESTYNNDANFREAVTIARRGRVATFFDSTAEKFYQKLGLSRDVLHDYQTTGDSAADTAKYDEIMTEYFDVKSNSTIETATTKTSSDSDGNQSTSTVKVGSVSSNITGSSDAKTRAEEFLNSVGDIVESSSEKCAAMTTGDLVATAVASNAKYTYANTFMTVMESISKAMAGDGDNSGINSVLNWFTEPKTTTVYNATTGEESQVTGTPLEAQSVRTVLSGTPIDQSKTRDYSLERAFDSTEAAIGSSPTTCSADQTNDIGLSLNAKGNPGSNFVQTVIGTLLDSTLGSGFKITASTTLSLLIPSIAEVMYGNTYTDTAVGVSGGELFGMGAANVNQLAAQQNSGATGASKEKVLAYNHANNEVIAQQAEIDRKNHSPFDASNSNTFLGSIVSSFLPLATTSSTIFSPISTFSSISATSLASINPAYADGENTSYLTNFGSYCQKAESIGAVSNVYCNMIAVNDLSVIDIPESDPTYQKVISESVDIIDGKEVVREGSPLADFITYWTGRYSMPGIYDANIASACEESRTGNIPILSSIIAALKPVSAYCQSVADGSRYVDSESNPYWSTEKYHQLWVLNTRVKENLGFYQGSTNPLTAYREQYDAAHPLDNSRAGYLARISGLTKYDAETVIALFDYYQKVANYHPENAYQFASVASNRFDATNYSDNLTPGLAAELALVEASITNTSQVRYEEISA